MLATKHTTTFVTAQSACSTNLKLDSLASESVSARDVANFVFLYNAVCALVCIGKIASLAADVRTPPEAREQQPDCSENDNIDH